MQTGTITAIASSRDMRRPSSRRESRSERRVIAGGIDAGGVAPCIEDASGMAMAIRPEYVTGATYLNPEGARRSEATEARGIYGILPLARELSHDRATADDLPGQRRYGAIEEILSHAN